MAGKLLRRALRAARAPLWPLDAAWRHLIVATLVGALGALAVEGFRWILFALESKFVGASDGHLVAAARSLAPWARLLAPACGGLAAGMLLSTGARDRREPMRTHGGDYIEAVIIGNGWLDLRGGGMKVLASLLVVSTGGAIGREGAMVLLAAMVASLVGRVLGREVELRLVVSCGAAAGLAAAYHAPLAGAVFVAEILLGSLSLMQLGPVVVAAVMSYGITLLFGEPAVLFPVAQISSPHPAQIVLMLSMSLAAGVAGALLLHWLAAARLLFGKSRLPVPLKFALGGLCVGLLSLWRPEVWGNGYSSIQTQLAIREAAPAIALVLVLKILAVGATAGSGAPGGVFTPTLFIGAAFGALAAAVLHALGAASAVEPVYAVVGMAVLLASTTRAPVMAALMVFEMTGRYGLLPIMLPACVIAALLSRRLYATSVYGQAGAPSAA